MAGIVESVREGVKRFKAGDEVYGMTGGIAGIQGSLAEYAAVDADLLAIKPRNITMQEAAAIPLIFITAWEALVDKAQTGPGKTVLIHGGAGVFTLYPLISGKGRAHHGAILGEATALIEAGKLTPLLHPADYILETIEKAYGVIEDHTAKGKVVISIG